MGNNTVQSLAYCVNSLKALVTSFKSNLTTWYAPLNVIFTDTSTGMPPSWKWAFGDDTNSTIKDTVSTYRKVRKYNVTFTIKNQEVMPLKRCLILSEWSNEHLNLKNKIVKPKESGEIY